MVWVLDKEQVSVGRREKYSTYSFALLLWRWKRSFELPHPDVRQDPFIRHKKQRNGFRKLLTDRAELVSLKLCKNTFNDMRHCHYEKYTFKTMGSKPQKYLSNIFSFFCYLI